MEKKISAVEWLVEQITNGTIPAREAIQQAKAMEKEQHDKTAEEWWKEGAHYVESGGRTKWESFEQYYNETFKQNKLEDQNKIYHELAIRGFKVLVACEESQTVCKAFRALGIEAYSCDLQEESGGHPEWHIQGDAIEEAYSGKYDMMIAHPPCTYMSKAGARWMYPTAGNLCQDRYAKAMEAKDMFLKLLNAPIKHIAVENPVPLKIVELPEHSQAVQPYEYGHKYSKKTLLWLKNLPLLNPTEIVTEYEPYLPSNTGGKKRGQKHSRGTAKNAKESSKTFEGIGRAMAEQWLLACYKF